MMECYVEELRKIKFSSKKEAKIYMRKRRFELPMYVGGWREKTLFNQWTPACDFDKVKDGESFLFEQTLREF